MNVCKEDVDFARIALLNKIITEKDLQTARDLQRSDNSLRPLSITMLKHKIITKIEFRKILDAQKHKLPKPAINIQEKKDDFFFAYVAYTSNVLDLESICLSFRIQHSMAKKSLLFRLSEIMLNSGLLSLEKVDDVFDAFRKYILPCPACKTKYNMIGSSVRDTFLCKKCGETISQSSYLLEQEQKLSFHEFQQQISLFLRTNIPAKS